MKSLADQLRDELAKPVPKSVITEKPAKPLKNKKPKATVSPVLEAIRAFDTSLNKSMVHVRFDEKTVRVMNQFKMAANVDVTKLVAFAVKQLLDNTPELKTIIKNFIENQDL